MARVMTTTPPVTWGVYYQGACPFLFFMHNFSAWRAVVAEKRPRVFDLLQG